MDIYKREKYIRRIRHFYDDTEIIKVITGIRRCGKSKLMESIVGELIDKGVKKENIIYIDLDKYGFRKIRTAEALEKLIMESKEIEGTKYLFIDEIQNVKNFEEVINEFRLENDYSIFITGSNSYLLSGELVTKLTGRYIEFELFTLGFDEYIDMKKYYNINVDSNVNVELNNYILEGGFPKAIFLNGLEAKRDYTTSVIIEIFEKDIKKRVKIKNKSNFDLVRNFVMNNFGSTFSIHSLCESLKKNGIDIKDSTVEKYIQCLIDAKIIYSCERFDMKSKKYLSGEKKYYLSDLSLYFSLNTDNRINYGPVLENIVYQYARSKSYSVSVGRIGKLECDFTMRDKEQNYAYIQVSYSILNSKETEDREYTPLESIKDNYEKYVMTTDIMLQKRNGIKHVNIMDFIIDDNEFCK